MYNPTTNYELCINDLASYINAINQLVDNTNATSKLLWFRGHGDFNYKLLPNLYRNSKKIYVNEKTNKYSSMHLRENMRLQHYHARNYPFIKNDSLNSLEWMGIAQHHGLNTRLLDWSTSAIHALIFAVEKHLESLKQSSKIDKTPCVWILQPQVLNQRIVEKFINNDKLPKKLLESFTEGSSGIDVLSMTEFFDNFRNNFDEYKYIYLESDNPSDFHLNYIYNLAYFDELLLNARNNPIAVFSRAMINPIYLILSKYYIEGCIYNKSEEFPFPTEPLAIIHPQHSDRIRAQQGVFTIFPFPQDANENMCMENAELTNGILHKIIIQDPYKIAEELKQIGVNISWLYPESPIINSEIEKH